MTPLPSAGLKSDEVSRLLALGPDERVALLGAKSSPRLLAETLAALANADGGFVVLGVDAAGHVQADNDSAVLKDRALHACVLTDPPLVLPAPGVAATEQGEIVLVQVPPGLPNVYNVQGVFLTRMGAHNRPLTTPELRRLLLDRGEAGVESQIVADAGIDALETTRVVRYLDRLLLGPGEDPTATLIARGCAAVGDDGQLHPTVAGLLLFAANPQQRLPSADFVCVRFPGKSMGDEFVRQDVAGPLPDQIRQAETFVVSTMRRGMRISGLAREDVAEYPTAVVREAIVNAVAHRDYGVRGEGIRLLMFDDRLEIYSPGRLAGHVTLENLKDERYSRNQIIVTVLSDLGYVERLGYGIDRMIGVMRAAGQPDPLFQETAAGFQVTLRSALEGSATLAAHAPVRRAIDELNDRQRLALAIVRENGRIANSDLQAMAPEISPETVRRDLADLVERNLLIRIGSKRATYYILK